MAGGTKTRARGRLTSEQCPGHNLSLAEALQVVNAKLSQADDARYVRVAHLLSISLKTYTFCPVGALPFRWFVLSRATYDVYLTLGSDPILGARNVQGASGGSPMSQ